jgi:hypothetical protein
MDWICMRDSFERSVAGVRLVRVDPAGDHAAPFGSRREPRGDEQRGEDEHQQNGLAFHAAERSGTGLNRP